MKRTESDSTRQFAIEPPGSSTQVAMWLLCLVLPLSITGIALGMVLTGADPARLRLIGDNQALTTTACIGGLIVVMLPLALWLHRLLRNHTAKLQHGVLALRAVWYRQRIAVSDLDLSKSRVLSLDEFPEYRPMLKTNAISMPGFRAGHFRLRNLRSKVFCILTSRQKVLLLQERGGRIVLLSLCQPRALLDALKDAATT